MLLKENSSVLIPIDFSKQSLVAIRHSYNIAKLTKSKLIIMHVYKPGASNQAAELEILKGFEKDRNRPRQGGQSHFFAGHEPQHCERGSAESAQCVSRCIRHHR